MKNFIKLLFVTLGLMAGLLTSGMVSAEMIATAKVKVTEVSVLQVQQFLKDKPANVVILDANNAQARADVGVVPGAVLLSSYGDYALTELPANKKSTLVFYCYNSYCQASHAAALRAINAGYTDARVMKAGIVGWNMDNKKM